jgi:hypothetical protein
MPNFPVSKLDGRNIGRLRQLADGRGGGGGAKSYDDGEKAWSSINHSILSTFFLNFHSTTGETEVRIKRLADFLCTGTSQIFYTHELAGFFIYLSKISTLPQDAYVFLNYIQTGNHSILSGGL